MPELPDITLYAEAIAHRAVGQPLLSLRLASPFLLRTVDPPLTAFQGQPLVEVRRLGKRLALGFPQERWLVWHLMRGGRFHWRAAGGKLAGKQTLAACDFPTGSLQLTEAGSQHRAGLWTAQGESGLAPHRPPGIEPLECTAAEFAKALARENHTLKRVLCDQQLIAGIGNAYSDEILHRARLSPVALTNALAPEAVTRLYQAVREVLIEWTERLRFEARSQFPTGVTAFRPQMAVHGRFGLPCPACQAPVARIRYADRETNYCPGCQTGGRLLADRSLSRLLKNDWPRRLEEQ